MPSGRYGQILTPQYRSLTILRHEVEREPGERIVVDALTIARDFSMTR